MNSAGLTGGYPIAQNAYADAAAGTRGGKRKTGVQAEELKSQQPQDQASLSTTSEAVAVKAVQKPSPVEGAKKIPGMFTLYQKGEKVWFSIEPDQLNKPFFFSANVSKGVGEKRLTGSVMGDSFLAEFRKAGNQVQLVALHTENFAEAGTPQEHFVKNNFADSLISSAPVVESSHSDTEVLVEANSLLFKDIPGYLPKLKRAYDTNFTLDASNTHITQVDNSKQQTSFGVQTHYQTPAHTAVALPTTTPVANSVLPEFRYNFLKLPDEPMKPRLADERIGHFVTTRKDYTGDEGDGVVRYVNRWRLDKQDPQADMSKPVQPITFWIGKEVPEEYREAVRDGILEWNKAFEAIGFQDAIEVKQQQASDTFDTLDARHASVNWYTASDVGAAVGPSHVDPRSGEILDADIRMADVFGRSAKRFFMDNVAESSEHTHGHTHDGHTCSYQDHAGLEQTFADGLLRARGDSKAAQDLAKAYVKDVIMHEVGHTLGLRHNFKGSTIHSAEQLQDPEFTKEHGLSSSVMDYHPFNLAGEGEKQGELVMSTLGAYDYLAVKYAYMPLDEAKEAQVLNEIAKQTTVDPKLAFETDEAADDMDPTVSRFDLGNNPLEFAQKEIALARELWNKAQTQELPEDTKYTELTRSFQAGLGKVSRAATLMTRYVGGMTLRRDRAGTGNPIYEPIPAETQREALQQLTSNLFSPESFRFRPEFVSRLGQERFGKWGNQNVHVGKTVTDMQTRVLKGLLDPGRTQRLIDNPEKLAHGQPTLPLSEVLQTVQNSIWSELADGQDISQGRRDLQRNHLKEVLPMLSEHSKAPGEARSVVRYLARELKTQIDSRLEGPLSLEQRAHLEDSSHTLGQALAPKE